MEFKVDDLSEDQVIELLTHHLSQMAEISPRESRHVLDVEQLKGSDVTFWTLWNERQLLGCAALKELSKNTGEIKSMKVAPDLTGQGIGKLLLGNLLQQAKKRSYKKIYLETGSMSYFEPARQLYLSYGFDFCEPFADYVKDANNVFMYKVI